MKTKLIAEWGLILYPFVLFTCMALLLAGYKVLTAKLLCWYVVSEMILLASVLYGKTNEQ